MNPCRSKKKRIANLVLGCLGQEEASAVRAHLAVCDPCRRYCDDVSQLAQRLGAGVSETGLEVSAAFHQRLLGRLHQLPARPSWAVALAGGWSIPFKSWAGLTGAGAAAAALALILFVHHSERPLPVQPRTSNSPLKEVMEPPTVGTYQAAAERSFDELDALLTRQANRSIGPSRTYTAGIGFIE